MPRGWPHKPSGLSATQKEFRFLFGTSTGRKAQSSNIADYNSFVQGRAAAGHTSIRSFSSKFRVVGSTGSVDARDNTATTYTASDKGPSIWWLNGSKAADNYQDFYDGSWDSESGKNESGNGQTTGCGQGGRGGVWTGSNNNGTKYGNLSLGGSDASSILGGLNCSRLDPLSSNDVTARDIAKQLYALSPVIKLLDKVAVQGVSVASTPANATPGYAAGETIQLQLDFVEAVQVIGAPYVVLNIAGAARRATYASGSGTRYLNFEYTVQAADFDSDGISLCSNTSLDAGCGRITLDGGSISAQSDGLAAELDLPALGNQSGHKVDGMPPDPLTPPMANPGTGTVPREGWALKPAGIGYGDSFRLLFATPTRNATSADINDYNNHAINAAGTGHAAIRTLKNGFRVIASTEAVDAKDNAGLTGTGVPIYWLGSDNKVADDYADLLDGSWGNENPTDKAGATASQTRFWTGSTDAGVELILSMMSRALGATSPSAGVLRSTSSAPLSGSSGSSRIGLGLYALSQVLSVPPQATRQLNPSGSLAPTSRPRQGDTYRVGETFIFPFEFTEPVVVRGVPTMPLKLDSGTVRARYVSGSGSKRLLFGYTVQTGDYEDNDGEFAGPFVTFARGDSYMALDGASVRALADGSPALLVASSGWFFPYGAFGGPHKIEGRRAFATGASISSSPASGSTYGAGETITVSLAMNEAVRVTGRPFIRLDVGGARRRADYAGPIGEATDALEFSYVVQSGDFDADGVALCASGPGCGSIQLDGGSIRAAAGDVDANLRLPELAAQAGHRVDAAAALPVAPTVPSGCTDATRVPADWPLQPSAITAGGKFRLMFKSSNTRDATSSNIADYNTFVQGRAAAGHTAIRPYSAGFQALGSTASTDARDNTCTTGTSVPIYWLNGVKVADNYPDFYDGGWDDETHPKNERGSGASVSRFWTGSNANGTEHIDLSNRSRALGATNGAGLGGCDSVTLGALNESGAVLKRINTCRTNSHPLMAVSQLFLVPNAAQSAHATTISIISTPASGDTYRLGETIEFEVTFSEEVAVRATPQLALVMRDASDDAASDFRAGYVRSSSATTLVFAYTVAAGDRAAGGIATSDAPLELNGARITVVDGSSAVSALTASSYIQAPGSRSKIDSALTLSAGICDRTLQVRDAIVAAVTAASDCSQVTEAHLAALTGTLEVGGLTSIAAGDFAGLSGITTLNLFGSGIETLPAGLFDGFGSLASLGLRVGLTDLPKDYFRGLGGLGILILGGNRLAAGGLPDGIFEPLTKLVYIELAGNPGSDSFRPAADAGPGGTLSAGQTVTLGGPGTGGGPWGSNVSYEWTQTDGDDMAASTVTLSAADAAKPGFTVPALSAAAGVKLRLRVTGRGGARTGGRATSLAEFTIRALAPTGLAVVSKPVEGEEIYRRDEKIEVAVTFGDRVLVDTSLGTPTLGLGIGSPNANRQARYVRGSGTNRLVFEYTVQRTDGDGNGIEFPANGLALNSGTIVSVYGVEALLAYQLRGAQAGHKVGGSREDAVKLTGGICGRTPQLRDKLVELVKANRAAVTNCSLVMTTDLAALTERLDLRSAGIATLKRGDFANLGGISTLTLGNNDLTALPAGVFEGFDDTLTALDLSGNELQTIPAGVFDGLTGLTSLRLNGNDLSSLPPRIFEKLTRLTLLDLQDNPGSADFVPTAKAEPEGGIGDVPQGASVTLGAADAAAGYDDPWGSNVEHAWTHVPASTTVAYDAGKGADTANPSFTAPAADGTLTFTLTVTGKGASTGGSLNRHRATADIAVRVAAGPKVAGVAFASQPTGGNRSDYRTGETIEVALRFDREVSVETAGGTPSVTLTVGTASRVALYLGGSGARALIFDYVVQAADRDTDGVDLVADSLALNGGTIVAVFNRVAAALGHAALAGGNGRWVNRGGICDRTPAVRDAIVAAVTAASDCSQVTESHLAALTETLEVGGLTSIGAGDFAGLSGVETLGVGGSGIETLPVGLFEGLDSLTFLSVVTGLTHLPKDIFRGLGKLTTLYLWRNDIGAGGLPDGIFEPLTGLTDLKLSPNSGAASFSPAADAGPGGTLSAGETVTLGGPGTSGGPWGSNVTHAWTQTDGDDNAVSTVTLSATDVAKPGFTVPALSAAAGVKLVLTVRGLGGAATRHAATSEAEFTIRGLAPTGVAVVSKPVDGGDTYKQGEKIEVAVTFGDRVRVDTSLGTPALTLSVGAAAPRASYVRGSGTNRLVFAHTVVSGNSDSDGIAVMANRLALHGGAIASVYGAPAILDHAALAAQSGHKVVGSDDALSGGICGRTPQLRDKLVELVKAKPGNSGIANCSLVDPEVHLAALTGNLDLRTAGIATLKRGDFANLGGISTLTLGNNDLTVLPAGVFEGLDDTLTALDLSGNELQTIPAGVFDGLTGLTSLRLNGNDLSSLPPRIFEKLTRLTLLDLQDNPGSADFVPIAKAGPEGGFDVASGGSVTLGVKGAAAGSDDPWGSNVEHAWTHVPASTTVTYDADKGANTARPVFTAPDGTLTFTLTVTGRGEASSGSVNRHRATADIAVRVGAGPKVAGVAFASEPAGGNRSVYTAGETIEVALRFDREVSVETAGGTPSVMLTVGTASRAALYRGGSGTRALIFGYVVQAADSDTDGVDLAADSLALNGGTIVAVSNRVAAALGHAALAGGNGQRVNGGFGEPGICGRTPAVQAAILDRVKGTYPTVTSCTQVTGTHLRAIGGRLDVSAQVSKYGRMTALKAGDLDGLTGVTALDLDNHALRSFPAGIFGPLTALTELSIAYNQTQAADRLRSLPAGPFEGLTKLTTLRLEHNDLETLPDRIFQPLTSLTTLTLHGNPGSATFLPIAVAGPEGGIDARAGHPEKLGGDAGGPWGNNLVYSWRKAAGTAVDPSATNIQEPTLTAPALAEAAALEYELTVTARGTSLTATDRVIVRVAAAALATEVTLSSTPIADSEYRRGEKIQAMAAFSKPVTVTGTPQLGLSVGTQTPRQATYVGGSGTRRLVFEYTVVQADSDSDGIAIAANSLSLNGGAIVDADGAVALLDHGALAAQSGHKVVGSDDALTGGICDRTPQLRDKLVELVKANESNNTLTCSLVTATHLAALTGTLQLGVAGIATLKPGDFADLGGIERLILSNNDLTALPAGVFEGLDDTLIELKLDGNDLQTIPAGAFDEQSGLTVLHLHGNDLSSLPAGVFDPLTNLAYLTLYDNELSSLPPRFFEPLKQLTLLTLHGNPGTARFKPTAKAGPEGGFDVAQGGSVTLGVDVPENGYDDLWGTNVTRAWSRTEGTGGTLTDVTAARAAFTAPASDGTHAFRLTVTGGGGVAATADISVHVGAAGPSPMLESAVVNGPTLTLTYSEKLQAEPPSNSGKGQVYLAVVSEPWERRTIEPVPLSAVVVMGNERQVILTLDPPVEYNQVVTLSYFPDNATAESRIRDLGDNLADGFTGLRVRNETLEGNTIQNIALTGEAKTYRIGDTVGIEVTFTEAVDVTGAPTLALEIGAASRKAAYVRGSGSAVLTFEYTVVEGEEDTDGIAVEANGLAVPAGGSILDTADREAAILRHGRVHFPDRKVDGVRPTATAAAAAGPTVTVTWSEALDEASVPTGAGGFRVRIGNANGPAVSAVAVSGSAVTLSLASAMADGTQDVTLEYTPPRSGAKIRDAAGNDAAAIPRADALAVTVTLDTRAPEVAGRPTVDGATLTVIFDEALDAASVPAAPGGFTATVTRDGNTVSGYTVSGLSLSGSGTVVTLTLAQAVRAGDAVTLAYAKPSTPLRDRASTPNEVADFGGQAVDNLTPSVKGVPAFAGPAQALAIGDRIAVEVEFTEAVSVTATATARPELALEIGAETVKARYASGSGSARLRFEYEIAEGDADGDGVAIPADALAAPTGSAIRTAAGRRAVQLGHDAVAADAARTVDGVRPIATAAEAAGPTVTVTWSEALDAASAPTVAGGFRVRIGTANGPAVTAVAVSGSTVTLNLASAIADGAQDVTLEYTPPRSGAKIRDAAGNDAAAILRADALAVTVTPDTRAPEVAGRPTVGGATLTVTFDEALDTASVPAAPGGFTVTVTRDGDAVPGHTVSGLSLSGSATVVTLTLAKGVLPGDTVTLAYSPPSPPLRDRAATPNDVAAFSGRPVDNGTVALAVSLSKTEAVEGDDGTVTLTVAPAGGGAAGAARAIAIAVVSGATAEETGDWTLAARSLTLGAGERSVSAAIGIVDDARLEGGETVSFAVTADGAAIGQVTLAIADDDRAVLTVQGPAQPVTEGGAIELTLRLEPHPDNVANAAAVPGGDACILDFPVSATLTRAGDTAAALPSGATLETDHVFAAEAFDKCTREVTVSVPTRASDGVWMADRTLTFALAPQQGTDPRVVAGEPLPAAVRDDTPPPGPMVTSVAITPMPAEASEEHGPRYSKDEFLALPAGAVHGPGTRLTFKLTFDTAVTVTPDPQTRALPELVLDVFGRERRAQLSGNRTDTGTLTFRWTVSKGDNDPDGIRIASIDLKGAGIRFAAGCTGGLPCDMDVPTFKSDHAQRYPKHRVRGGLHAMRLAVSGSAREGEPFTVTVRRDGRLPGAGPRDRADDRQRHGEPGAGGGVGGEPRREADVLPLRCRSQTGPGLAGLGRDRDAAGRRRGGRAHAQAGAVRHRRGRRRGQLLVRHGRSRRGDGGGGGHGPGAGHPGHPFARRVGRLDAGADAGAGEARHAVSAALRCDGALAERLEAPRRRDGDGAV